MCVCVRFLRVLHWVLGIDINPVSVNVVGVTMYARSLLSEMSSLCELLFVVLWPRHTHVDY